MTAKLMKCVGRSTLESVLARAGTVLLRRCLRAPASMRLGQVAVGTPSMERQARFRALIERTRTGAVVELLRIKLGFPREVFERAVSPVIEGYAEYVQQLSAAGSGSPSPDELFVRGLDVSSRALDYRRGQILPRGAAPEVIGAQAHRWTYAVFVAALHRGATRSELPAANAAQFLERFVPQSVLDWLAEDPDLIRELQALLSGVASAQGGAIRDLVYRAATESGGHDPNSRSRDDLAGREISPRKTRQEVMVEAGIATVAARRSAVPDEEPDYIEDAEKAGIASDRMIPASKPDLEQVPDAARGFLAWLQAGLSKGTIAVNQAGAFVHFVNEGMLLVSPRVFHEFAKHCAGGFGAAPGNAPGAPDLGISIQRKVLRAGWHLRADKGVNILNYQIMRRNRPASRLSGVVIPDPVRFVDPVPAVNPLLIRMRDEPAGV